MTRWARQTGMTLVELMVALAVGALLILGLVQVFGASRTAYQLSQGLARVQENGRFAMDTLQRDLRMTGHLGCVNDQARFLPENNTGTRYALTTTFVSDADLNANPRRYGGSASGGLVPEALRFDKQVQGYEGTGSAQGNNINLTATPTTTTIAGDWTPALPPDVLAAINTGTVRPVRGSDVLVLRFLNPVGASLSGYTPGTTVTMTYPTEHETRLTMGVNNPVLFGVADCMGAAVFQATSFGGGTLTVQANGANKSVAGLNRTSFTTGQAALYRAESEIYFVGTRPGDTVPQPSLYRVRFDFANGAAAAPTASPPEEIVEGIESMQLRFGRDTRTDATQRPTGNIGTAVRADEMAALTGGTIDDAWRRVGLVEIGLVARSPDSAAAMARDPARAAPLMALGVTFTPPNDRRYRTVYEQSIALRNRLFGN